MPLPLHQPIDWMLIVDATRFYAHGGFQHVEVPWVVPPPVTAATIPPGIEARRTQDGDLIGSGEQGLLALAVEGRLGPGLYQTTTPCFRNDAVDHLHGKHFMKVELMHLADKPDVTRLVDAAMVFFASLIPVQIAHMNDGGLDIVDERTGMELGSYGVREWQGIRWAYGTGVAEPRLSTALGYEAKGRHP